jgi:hypothetical protein
MPEIDDRRRRQILRHRRAGARQGDEQGRELGE